MAKDGSYLSVPGATLYYQIVGTSGPLLVLIPVSNGSTLFYESLATHLAPYFRVLIYDRRGYYRSQTDKRPTLDDLYQTHAADVAALIQHVSSPSSSPAGSESESKDEPEPAFIFTTSASSGIATDLLLTYPHLVRATVLHEPALVRVIPDPLGAKIIQDGHDIEAHCRRGNLRAANAIINLLLYTDTEWGLFKATPVFGKVPAIFKLEDAVYYLCTEIPGAREYRVDRGRLKEEAGRGRVKLLLGREPAGVLARAPGEALAGVGVPVGTAPGGHVGYVTHAREFAECLRKEFLGRNEAKL